MEEQRKSEFLTEAKEAVTKLEADRKECEGARKAADDAQKDLDSLKKKIEEEKEDTVAKRRADVDRTYEKQIKGAEKSVSRAENRRESVRSDREADRIKEETRCYETANRDRKEQMRQIAREHRLPGYVRRYFFLYMFAPRGLGEVLKMLLVFVVALGLIPYCLYKFLPLESWQLIAAVAGYCVLVIGLYILIYSATVKKDKKAVNEIHDLMDQIREDEKTIKKIEKQIRKDKDDTPYDLGEYDAEIARTGSQKNEIVLKKQQALNEFDAVTAPKLVADIDAAYAKKLDAATQKAAETGSRAKELEAALLKEELEVNEKYTQYIGAKNMKADVLESMIEEEKAKEAVVPAEEPVFEELPPETNDNESEA